MTDNTQELDEILEVAKVNWQTSPDEIFDKGVMANAKNQLLAWHNKQVEEVIKKPRILPKNAQYQESVKQGINFYHRQMRKRVDKLKEQTNDQL